MLNWLCIGLRYQAEQVCRMLRGQELRWSRDRGLEFASWLRDEMLSSSFLCHEFGELLNSFFRCEIVHKLKCLSIIRLLFIFYRFFNEFKYKNRQFKSHCKSCSHSSDKKSFYPRENGFTRAVKLHSITFHWTPMNSFVFWPENRSDWAVRLRGKSAKSDSR